MAVSVTINDNLPEVLKLFDSALSKALLKVGLDVQADAAENSPVRTGNLRKSWTVHVEEDEGAVYIGVPEDALDGNYAKYVEFGTRKMAGQHMLQNAVTRNVAKIKGDVETEMRHA